MFTTLFSKFVFLILNVGFQSLMLPLNWATDMNAQQKFLIIISMTKIQAYVEKYYKYVFVT